MPRNITFIGKFRLTSGQHASAMIHTNVTILTHNNQQQTNYSNEYIWWWWYC